jgi:hypothetical protein
MRKVKHRGLQRVGADFLLNLIGYNLVRIPRLRSALQAKLTRTRQKSLPQAKEGRQIFPVLLLSDLAKYRWSRQRRPIAKANFVGTVHHGIPTNLHTPIYNPRGGFSAESHPKSGPTAPFT